jgi:PAS domain S-box-containing protein
MTTNRASLEDLLAENAEMRARLEEAEDTLRAIREGEVDALVVSGPAGEQIYTLKGADHSYRILIEAINEGAATVALDGDILYANQQLAEILATPLERLIGTPICNYVEAATRELLMALLEQGRQGAGKGEVSLRNRHGVTVPAYLSFKSFKLQEAPGAVCLVVTDLTEQKRQEAILAEEKLSRAILEQAEAVILVVDREGRIIRASHEARQLYPGNLLLRPFDEVFRLAAIDTAGSKSGRAAYRPFSVSPILQGRIYHGLEVSFYPPDGQDLLQMLLNAGPLRGSQGEVIGAVVALMDITARKKAEAEREALLANIQAQAEELQALNEELETQTEELAVQAEELRLRNEELDRLVMELRDSEERYRRLVELSPDAILVHADGSYVFANPAAARFFGAAAPEELCGKPVLDLVYPPHRDQLRERMQQALRGKTTKPREFQIMRLDGRAVDVEVAGVGITYQGKSAVQIVMRDVTERKRAEEALKAAHGELEQKVQDRTAELRHMVTQLQEEVAKRQQAEEFLQESEGRLRHLTSQLLTVQEVERRRLAMELHDDLGQSLMVLKMQLAMAQSKVPPEASETKESLEHSLDFIDKVVDSVRRLSRNLRPEILEDLGLAAALRHLFEEFSRQDIRVSMDIDDIRGLFSLEAQLNIYRIFQESFSNITKYAQASHVSMSVKRQDGSVVFQVEDNGRGFDHQKVSNQNATSRGLGLTAMEERARMLGGSLNIWSREGQGAKITLIVPIQGSSLTETNDKAHVM